MTAKQRNLNRQFTQTHTTQYKNLLVSGCSFTWNNSEEHICNWPYYLRDIAGFEQVVDCSQSGAGTNHIFNSIINEIETTPDLTPDNTLVVIMWSGLTRTDVIATQDITQDWHRTSNYCFDNRFATLSIFNLTRGPLRPDTNPMLENLCQQYKRLIDTDAQVYESLLKIIALWAYITQKGFRLVFTSWKDPAKDVKPIKNSTLVTQMYSLLDPIQYLDEYSFEINEKEPDGHPTPDGYLRWTREHLIPYLVSSGILELKS